MRDSALSLLRRSVDNPEAEFRDGQWEAIQTLVEDRARLLVVQRTGWGKSVVYFLATRLLRERGAGPTLLVSPLLALMRNQIEAARRIGVEAAAINSTNRDAWDDIERRIADGTLDVLLISPERLANDSFRQNVLQRVAGRVGLFVVDEAHCISDWGHDFRPDYQRIVRVLRQLPPSVAVLATTATANDRVVHDVEAQLGRDVRTIRGGLGRSSLRLQATRLPRPAERLAWLAEHLPQIEGNGIVYVRTVRDAHRVSAWLQSQGLDAEPYYGSQPTDEREALEQRLLANGVKALVATSALGMGFDKPDLGFVVHYQRPGSVVAYYQQVGRAGRAVADAYGVLLSGTEDDAITDYFIESAFPPADHVEAVLGALRDGGKTTSELQASLNLSGGQIGKVLKRLDVEDPSPVARESRAWVATGVAYAPDLDHQAALTAIRRAEQEQLQRYMAGERCLMAFLRDALDDPDAQPCGRCAVCLGHALLPEAPDPGLVRQAAAFLDDSVLPIEPRKQRPDRTKIPEDVRAEPGRALCFYDEPGWGRAVARGREAGHLGDDLVEAAAALVRDRWRPRPAPQWVTSVPSQARPDLVPDFARRLADRLGLPFVAAVGATRPKAPQAEQSNSHFRLENLRGAYAARVPQAHHGQPVLLVDDLADSTWTLTVVAGTLRKRGAGPVLPLALALSGR